MKSKGFKIFLVALLIISVLMLPVTADTTLTFTTPGTSTDTTQSQLAGRIQNMIDMIQGNYYKDVKTEDLINGALKGMFEVLDPHSTYFNKEEYQSFMKDLGGDLIGIGVQIERSHDRITVVSPIEGTPAYKAGLKTGDQIIYVGKTDISDYTVEKAAGLIRGQEGTKVRLGIRREGMKDIIYFDMIREPIEINPVTYAIKPGNIGYIKLTDFNENTTEKMSAAIDALKAKNVKGVIIDLRYNPGGLLDQVVDTCKLLIPKGTIVSIKGKGIDDTYTSELDKAPFKLVMLVNGGSASASEIMAGAVRDSKTGILVGEKTYGKGTVQHIYTGSDGTGYKLTIAKYLTPSGFALDGIGLKPDVEVKSNTDEYMKTIANITGTKGIKYNTVSLDVLGVQQRLKKLGYAITDQDGFFSNSTKAAVLKFQKANKLKQDATMDADDLKILQFKFEDKLKAEDPQLDRAMVEISKLLKK